MAAVHCILPLLLFLGGTVLAVEHHLPSYVKSCKRSDPRFNQCVVKHAQDAIPSLIRGDRKYQIPVLDPLEVKQIKVASPGFTLELKNAFIVGLKDTVVRGAHYDVTKKHLTTEVEVANLMLFGKYRINGKILVLPIQGNGDFNVTMLGMKMKYEFDYHLDNKQHPKLQNVKLVTNPSKVYFYLGNLFNGDPLLGKEMNEFMNREWKDVFKELSPGVVEAIQEILTLIVSNIISNVHIKEIFPD